ncbi:T9SS type A sorting domain-containing protein [Gelidibacter mesophilus]|uniref:T9SS type A sorting domain-containing protein n=1 Tax=Gelidibacter mesophilus TaxID=169050 RepID=UPI00146E8E82|nr:T9SS type A sorting domain-containing protein [Gelidibacter mesophilus]
MKHFYLIIFSVTFCFSGKAQDKSQAITVIGGTGVYIQSGTAVAASEFNLKSTSNSFSSLFLNEPLGSSTVVNYDRFVNVMGSSGVNGGNDLISMPVKKDGTVTYSEFLSYSNGLLSNTDVLPQHPTFLTTYAFGTYNNILKKYLNYDAFTDGMVVLKRGAGYRAAAKSTGHTVRFTGTVSTVTETVDITTAGKNRWNLVGNPYPTYLDSQKFLDENINKLDENAAAIYGYNSGTREGPGTIGNFTIINRLTYRYENIAPGQGFLVANKLNTLSNQLFFTTAMRVFSGNDDFILGRNANSNLMIRLKATNGSDAFATEIYFNSSSTLGVDPGYDAALFDGLGSGFTIYSRLVKNDTGQSMAIQSIGLNDLDDVMIPLGLKAPMSNNITLGIETSTLSENISVYLHDNHKNNVTLLNDSNYSFKTEKTISETGRFYLQFQNKALSNSDSEMKELKIFAKDRILFIYGQLQADAKISIYDLQGRLVFNTIIKAFSEKNTIDAKSLGTGIYVVKLSNGTHYQIKKVLIN